jgi:heme/copper-type cytochrome/quinol oxidase subunit 3
MSIEKTKSLLRQISVSGIGMFFSITFAAYPVIHMIENTETSSGKEAVLIMTIVGLVLGIPLVLISNFLEKKEIKAANILLISLGCLSWIISVYILYNLFTRGFPS